MLKKEFESKWYYIIGLCGIVILSSLPAFRTGIYLGHDIQFHLGRIQAIAEELLAGHIPVRYEADAWYGHGYVSTTFYGNIFLYIPAVFYIAGLPVWRCYNLYVILINIATVLVGYYSFKGLFKSARWGFLATGIYMMVGYRLSNLYVRAALGEYTAMVFIPLVIYGVYIIYDSADRKSGLKLLLPLIIGSTGLIQSHILTTEIVAVFIFVFALINVRDTTMHIKELLLSLATVLGLNAFFLIPFVDSYTSMKLYINTQLSSESIRPDGLYLKQLINPITIGRGGSSPWSTVDEGYLNIGALTLICMIATFVGLIIIFIKKKRPVNKMIITVFAFGVLAGWMSTIYFPWDFFAGDSAFDQLMSSVQYPWRYVLIMSVCFIITGVYVFRQMERCYFPVLVIMSGMAVLTSGVFYYVLSCANQTVANAHAEDNWADKLYLLDGTDRDDLANTEIIIDGNKVTIPVFAYENVHVYESSGSELEWQSGMNNCIQVEYDGDATGLYTRFEEPMWWRLSEIISIVTLVILVIAGRKEKNG